MPIEILMPALSPTMKEGNLAKWIKKEGENVSPGDVLAEIETDKATMEVEAVDEGVLSKILIGEGTANVQVNQAIAVLLEEGEDESILEDYKVENVANSNNEKSDKAEVEVKKDKPQDIVKTVLPKSDIARKQEVDYKVSTITKSNKQNDNIVIASPVAKRVAVQNDLDINQIQGTGPKGRVVKEDVVKFLSQPSSKNVVTRVADDFNAIPNSNIRNVIANRLLEAKQTIPHFYLTIDCKIWQLLDIRAQVNAVSPKDEGGKPVYKVSVNDLVIKASALALKKVPAANSSWTDEAVLQYNNIDISIAVSIPDGLITPIIRNADQKSVISISEEMKLLANKARNGALQPEEFQGGGFSISNLGMYGIKQFNAIVNPPQSAILAVGSGEKRVVVGKNDDFEAVDMMTVSLSCDHRVVDGAVGAEFLDAFRFYIENPATLLL